jgi:hypothetical protein
MSESSTTEGFAIETQVQPSKELKLDSREFIVQELSRGETIDLSAFPAILSQADIIARTGTNLGELVASVQLPYKESPFITADETKARVEPAQLYCFKSNDASEGRHSLPTYIVIGAEQLQDMIDGRDVADDAMLRFDEKGQTRVVGRESWLPDAAREYPNDKVKEDSIYRRSPAVSREQGVFELHANGHLTFKVSENAKNENKVRVSRGPKDEEEINAKIRASF